VYGSIFHGHVRVALEINYDITICNILDFIGKVTFFNSGFKHDPTVLFPFLVLGSHRVISFYSTGHSRLREVYSIGHSRLRKVYSTGHSRLREISIVASIVISKFLHCTILVKISAKNFFQ
jgi:hypothetical protein